MYSPTNINDACSNRRYLAEAIIKQYALIDFVLWSGDTDSGKELLMTYFLSKGMNGDPWAEGLLPFIQMKTAVLLMFPFVSYLHQWYGSEHHDPGVPDYWNATLATGKKDSDLNGTARVIAIVRHSIAHFLEGSGSSQSSGNDSASSFQRVDFEKRTFYALIGSVEFKKPEGFCRFFDWVCKTAHKRAHDEKWT